MAEKEDDKVFDVQKPGKAKPSMGSKPMIVGHKGMAADPMVKEEHEKEAEKIIEEEKEKVAKSSSKMRVEPISEELKSKDKKEAKEEEQKVSEKTDEDKPEESEKSEEDKPKDEAKDDGKKSDKKEAELDPTAIAMEREENLNKIIKSKRYRVDIKESKSGSFRTFITVFLVAILCGVIGIYLLIDTGTIKSDIELPFRIFGEEETTQNTDPEQQNISIEKAQLDDDIAEKTSETEEKVTILALDEPILLEILGDESKLPEDTPESFIEYMKSVLTTIDTDCPTILGDDVVPYYSVSKISDKYIEGGGVCGGGGHMDWYFLNDKWNTLPQQAVLECNEVIMTTLPVEFVESCFYEDNPSELVPNPNGSYYDM